MGVSYFPWGGKSLGAGGGPNFPGKKKKILFSLKFSPGPWGHLFFFKLGFKKRKKNFFF